MRDRLVDRGSRRHPLLMAEWRFVQPMTTRPPVRYRIVHQLGEAMSVIPLQQKPHLVDGEVFHALKVLLGELDVEPDVAAHWVALAPLGFHPADAPLRRGHVGIALPLRDHGRGGFAKLHTVSPIDQIASTICTRALQDIHQ